MYRPKGWSDDDLASYLDALTRPHDRRTVARVETVDRVFVAELRVLEGQVDGDALEPIERRCAATLLDEGGVFDGPSMDLQVVMVDQFHGSTFSGESPVFTGPVVRPPKREDAEVTLELQDRSAIAMRDRPTNSIPRKTDVSTVIERLLKGCGEDAAYIKVPQTGLGPTDEPTQVGGEKDLRPWAQARGLADSEDKHLMYDVAGYARLRDYPANAGAVDLSALVTGSGAAEPPSEVVNRVKVTGKRVGAEKHKRTLSAVRTLKDVAPGHPLDPSNIQVGGVAQFLGTVTESNTKLGTQKKVDDRADRLMRVHSRKLVETRNYTLIPFGLLDLWDVVRVGADLRTVTAYSFPLAGSGDMTLGYTAPLFVPKKSRKGRR